MSLAHKISTLDEDVPDESKAVLRIRTGKETINMADIHVEQQGDVRMHVSMIVNGSVRAITVEPRMTLLDALRDELASIASGNGRDMIGADVRPHRRSNEFSHLRLP